MDLSKLTDAELDALERGDLTKLSDAALDALEGKEPPAKAPSQKSAPTWMEKVAANPLTRFAVGAGEPYQGFTQRASEAKVPGLSIPALLSAAAKISRPGTDEAFADVKSMAKAGGAEGYDVAGLLGNIASPASLAVGKVPIPTSLMGKVGLGAGAGAAGGAMAPADTEAQARVNALIGAGAGGVLTPLIHGGGKAAEWATNTVGRPIADLFTKAGPMNIGRKYVADSLGPGNLEAVLRAARNADEILPGGKPMMDQVTAGMPEGSVISAIQKIVGSSKKGPSVEFGKRIDEQAKAIVAAELARDAATSPLRAGALAAAKAGGVKAQPVMDQVDALATKEGYRASDVVTKTLGHVRGKLETLTDETGVINPHDLYTIRKEVGSTIQKFATENANWDKGLTAKLERKIQLSIDDAIEGAGGEGWKKYLSEYAKASKLIDTYKLRQELASKPPQPTNLGGGVNIAEETRPHMGNFLSRPAMLANWAMKAAGKNVEPKVDKALSEIILNPARFAEEMSKLPPKTRIEVEKWLQRSNALTAGAAMAQ